MGWYTLAHPLQPSRHAIRIIITDDSCRQLFQFIHRIFHSIRFIRDLKHRNVIQGIPEYDEPLTVTLLLEFSDGIVFRRILRTDLQPVFRAVLVPLIDTHPLFMLLYLLIQRIQFFLLRDISKTAYVPFIKCFFGLYGTKSLIICMSIQKILHSFIQQILYVWLPMLSIDKGRNQSGYLQSVFTVL